MKTFLIQPNLKFLLIVHAWGNLTLATCNKEAHMHQAVGTTQDFKSCSLPTALVFSLPYFLPAKDVQNKQ